VSTSRGPGKQPQAVRPPAAGRQPGQAKSALPPMPPAAPVAAAAPSVLGTNAALPPPALPPAAQPQQNATPTLLPNIQVKGIASSTAASTRRKRRRRAVLPLAIAGLALAIMIGAGATAAYVLRSPPGSTAIHPDLASGGPGEAVGLAGAPGADQTEGNLSGDVGVSGSHTQQSDFAPTAVQETPLAAALSPAPGLPLSEGSKMLVESTAAAGSSVPGAAIPTPADEAPSPDFVPAELSEEEQFEQAVLALHADGKLLLKKEYATLRRLMADRFARQHADAIRQGLGEDYDAMMAWFDEHPSVRDELFLAMDPEADKIPEVLRLFNELRKGFPNKLAPYANLAIATAVVWDDERNVQKHDGMARATKASMPSGSMGALDNFRYLVEAESLMQGRIVYVPWEFLVYVVNHQTSQQERAWAMRAYLPKRAMFGKCYSDVPYDFLMLESDNERARLNGREYNLPNILTFGGVCMIQADFAARVGKSLGVPAAYVGGKGAYGGSHAWVMWAELKQATPTGLVFSLESHGRYRGDHYYVGHLSDPQTGARITDRDMELRLHTVGADTVAKRHADLVMQVYPVLREKAPLDTNQQLAFLSKVIGYCAGCEDAWFAVAALAREVSGDKKYAKSFDAVWKALFTTFARQPDFTWKVFDDLAAYAADPKQRNTLYERLIAMYETAQRPDLATEARLKLTDYLVEENLKGRAMDGLAITIRKFPAEGQLVPRLLDRLEELAADMPDADRRLAQFYTEFLPLIPQKRGDRPSEYCIRDV
jgi:hypothetical protein